jgi:hypothetical protein
VTKLRTTPEVNVPDKLPNNLVLLLCCNQSAFVNTVRRYRRLASEYGTSPFISMFMGNGHVAASASGVSAVYPSSSVLRPLKLSPKRACVGVARRCRDE